MKKLILVAAPPACGKTYVSQLIAEAAKPMVYLDKDDLGDLLRAGFAACGQAVDMDGAFYTEKLRPAEYSTILSIAFSALRFADRVVLNAPFGKEVRDPEYMRSLKEKTNELGAELLLVWVTAPLESCYERMKQRNSHRDRLKLAGWEEYVRKTNYTPPAELERRGAVDKFILFDNTDESTVCRCLQETMKTVLGEKE